MEVHHQAAVIVSRVKLPGPDKLAQVGGTVDGWPPSARARPRRDQGEAKQGNQRNDNEKFNQGEGTFRVGFHSLTQTVAIDLRLVLIRNQRSHTSR
jgi:hypothetical protein